ncbi:MAG: HAMP domain-containing protein [Cyanomargarita calcarea GSE-NOS-MK-12-04C]|jgi:twitching motility protein PilJ|uniref:HAMP domain-containing protein n=1 Tax=Cyanomargarita calcarea GSE-NOS-MK-12-04C TaxID=2839659 RepID=A0A951QRK6_9CYAN|nr:HAMP domain-containing protein [Cyanomargarita calcarea GSE-NOS-MK-12-04C]
MAASIEDYLEIYEQARAAYVQANYEQAATLIDQVVQNVASDPNTRLLRGHIYYVLQKYEIATEEYQKVLELTNDQELIDFANNGLTNINEYQRQNSSEFGSAGYSASQMDFASDPLAAGQDESEDLVGNGNGRKGFDSNPFGEHPSAVDVIEELSLSSPFEMPTDSTVFDSASESTNFGSNDPFALNEDSEDGESIDLPSFWQEDISDGELKPSGAKDTNSAQKNTAVPQVDLPPSNLIGEYPDDGTGDFNFKIQSLDDETLLMGQTALKNDSITTNNFLDASQENFSQTSSLNSTFTLEEQNFQSSSNEKNSFDGDESFDFEAFESAFGSETLNSSEDRNTTISGNVSKSNNIEFLDDFDEFDDLGNIPGFDLTGGKSTFDEAVSRSGSFDTKSTSRHKVVETSAVPEARDVNRDRDSELFSITGSQEAVPVFTQSDVSNIEPSVSVEQGLLAPLENASLDSKPWFIAGTVGIVSALAVATVSLAATSFAPATQREGVRNTGWAMALAALVSGSVSAGFMGTLTLKQIRRTTKDLQTQFDAVRQGNLNAQATVYSEDELGKLASGFNEMARVIFTTTNEAQRKADEQEEAKENLQRQVIRLLDDVEGAARGDLTVQAEVTADVLGAVADAFNLTIQNLRDIVQQVKVAAREVTKGATNSETFARALSSDALRQAEELAVTLNSVQVMTDSIQRVAEAAREAETVARDASTIALKGGEAVENTVAGILEIRETVAETTRKVKRLAESSQEISKIVALISQIASRTNLLALNASIEAARAGEAGRGFAIVADEVRQLADKSAKSLKEIEQIVMQIQSETGSVMTAMEEGTQQVIKGTKLAEEAKRSLENIIQVANRIDILVRSITTDTVEQTETSRAVAHVMQSVELTAQETSQEAQRVSGALQHLVGVSRDLIASVERFRVETAESR